MLPDARPIVEYRGRKVANASATEPFGSANWWQPSMSRYREPL